MHKPLVSVIIPTHNRWPQVRQAIDSVLAQSYGNIECIIVDDGSSDGSSKAIREHYGNRIRLLTHKPNREKSYSRNRGAKEAEGELICFLDSDDRLNSHSIGCRAGVFIDGFTGVVFGATQRPGNSREQTLQAISVIVGKDYNLKQYFRKPGLLSNNSFMLRREDFIKLGMYCESLTNMEDMQLFVRLLSQLPSQVIAEVVTVIGGSKNSARSAFGKIVAQYPHFSGSLSSDARLEQRLSKEQRLWLNRHDNKEYLGALYHMGQFRQYCQAYRHLRQQAPENIPTHSRFKKRYYIATIKSIFSKL